MEFPPKLGSLSICFPCLLNTFAAGENGPITLFGYFWYYYYILIIFVIFLCLFIESSMVHTVLSQTKDWGGGWQHCWFPMLVVVRLREIPMSCSLSRLLPGRRIPGGLWDLRRHHSAGAATMKPPCGPQRRPAVHRLSVHHKQINHLTTIGMVLRLTWFRSPSIVPTTQWTTRVIF